MSIKDLFGKTSPSLEETVQDVESVAFVENKTSADQTYHPQIDFSDPENFVYYGSAELYYEAAIRRIYEDYPYDGSKAEQIEFEEKASALERWVFENKYPKTTGHVKLGTTANLGGLSGIYRATTVPEYIRVWGGLHTNEAASSLSEHVATSAKYDNDNNRNQNWNCDFTSGATVEFWMKKDSTTANEAEVILDLWNGSTTSTNSRMIIEFIDFSNPYIRLSLQKDTSIEQKLIDISSHYSDSTWMHFAFSLIKEDSVLQLRVYVNGVIISTPIPFSNTFEFEGKMDAFLGALQTSIGGFGTTGSGKFQGYLDEFRFWKTKRTSRQIKLNWFDAIGGGANTDDATSDLGVYLKFNEGIVGTNAADSVVLDYSGRLANGVWVGYESTNLARSTDSAMESLGYTETPSPIIYKEHSSVSALISEMQTSGSVYDADRGQSFFRSMPAWLQEEDNGNLRLFSQILASYMDTLHVQIKELTELKTKRYPMEGVKASTMAADLLKDKGFMISTMFESDEVYEKLSAINLQDTQFETELHEIKNIIYTNIYNNLEKIYKTKGTEGSIRNLIRCYGIDDELIKLNLYTDGGVQYFTDKSRETSVKKKYVNFNDPTRFEASIYQIASSTNPNSFISSAVDASRNAFTMEADIVVPYKKEIDEKGYFATPFLSSSIMGFHEANANPAIFTWGTQNLSVYLVRDSLNSRHAKFVMRDILGTINEESDYIYDIYENEHYNVALRIRPQTYPYAGGVTNTTPSYDVELYAVTTNFGEIENEVILSKTISNAAGLALMNASKRVYVGAHTEDFTGAIQQETDLQIGGVRAWLDYLGNDEILQHNKDVLNYGMRSSIDGSNLYLIDDVQIPSQDLTIFNWDFDTITATDSSGEFIVEDITSGSADRIYGWIDDVIRREHKAKGSDFASSDSSIIDYEFIQAYKKQLPESAYDAQSIYIKGDQEINFSDDDDVSDNLFIMEKSPASLISEEMLKSFSTTLEFANLFMRPIERFRVEYKDLARARQLFFERVESDMDFDRFFEYFKWIDSSISSMVNQLVPMSANFAGGIVDVIEPHILERDKYQRQVGLLSTITSTEASIRGAQELKYNWRVGHAPLPAVPGDPIPDNENCLWQKERRENDIVEEEAIRQVLVTQNALTASNPINLSGSNGVYSGNTYATRRLSRPYTIDIGFSNSIHGGINYSINKDRDMITPQIAVGNSSTQGTPENIVLIGANGGNGTIAKPTCIDESGPSELVKYKYDGHVILGKETTLVTLKPKSDSSQYLYKQKISKMFPGNIVSSSVDTGYSSQINKDPALGGYSIGFDIVNLHSDTTDITNEISIQGPFTHTHIGGRQSRHIHYMEGFDQTLGKIPNIADRPEAWNIYIAELDSTETTVDPADVHPADGAIGITTPDYSVGTLDSDQQKATLYREERAKRPVNIKNIQTIIGTGPHGNYQHEYEVFSTFGDQGYFLKRAANLLPDAISQELLQTTNYSTLVAQSTGLLGNLQLNAPDGVISNRFTSGTPATMTITTVSEATLTSNPTSHDRRFTLTDANGAITTFKINVNSSHTGNSTTYSPGIETTLFIGGLTTQTQIRDTIAVKINAMSPPSFTAAIVGSTLNKVLITQNTVGTTGNTGIAFPNGSIHFGFSGPNSFQGGSYGVNDKPTQDRSTGSAHVIRTRFSAPGGSEVNSSGYLDVATQQYSVYNSINFRNLSVTGDSSGEAGAIRVNSYASRREGLRTSRARHQGQFGIDSQHGVISATDYISEASFHKQHRNGTKVENRTDFTKISLAAKMLIVTVKESDLTSPTGIGTSDNHRFTLTDSNGVTTAFRISAGQSITVNNVPYAPGSTTTFGLVFITNDRAGMRDQLVVKINAMNPPSFTATPIGDNVLVTQNTPGAVGNTEITFPDGAIKLGFISSTPSGPQNFFSLGMNGTPVRYDNMHFNTPIPGSDFQYSWISAAISGSNWEADQDVLTYAPKNGMISSSVGYHEALIFPAVSDMELDDCSQNPIAQLTMNWGNVGQFSSDSNFTLTVATTSTNGTILNQADFNTLALNHTNVGCSLAEGLFSMVINGQPKNYEESPSLPTLFFNPLHTTVFDISSIRSGYTDQIIMTLDSASELEPNLTASVIRKVRTLGVVEATFYVNQTINLVPFATTPVSGQLTIAEANEVTFSRVIENIICTDMVHGLNDGTNYTEYTSPAPWASLTTLYYSNGTNTVIQSTVSVCSNVITDSIDVTFVDATITTPTLVSNVTFYDDDGSGGRTTITAESKTTTVVPGSSSPGANQVSEAEANLTTFGYVASSHLADNIGGLEFELLERDVLAGTSQTFGPQATVPSSFSQIYYSSNSSDQVILTLTSRSTSGLVVEDPSTIIFNNATLDNTTLVSNASYPNWSYSASSRTTKTVTADATITLVADGTSTGTSQNKINETEANNNLSFSSVGTNMPCGTSASYQIYISENGATEVFHGTDPNNRPNVEYSAGDTIAYRVTVSQCTDAFGNPYTDEITITLQDAATVSGP